MKKFIYISIIAVTILSCKQDEYITEPKDWNYAGLIMNSYKIFEVEEINYDFSTLKYTIITDTISDSISTRYKQYVSYTAGIDTSRFFVKDSIVEKIENLEHLTALKWLGNVLII